ncbi:hypothetical protein [Ruania zhangjianzhongii]|uniref:hypothetical protein n=1 Tax=Ruania zhangjianzhongii TaxID=2603206 RepID=UPI0011CA8B74|nr:hypothetical protein [Ruania zhangjianzhongii]
MKTSTVRGVRSAVAASGVALLMFVAGCGGSDDAGDGNRDEQSAEADANGEEPAEDDSAAEEEPAEDDAAADEEPVEDDSAAEEEPAEDDGGSDAAASGAVAPGDDFDPCTVVDAAGVSDAVGFEVEDGQSDELMGGMNCTFVGTGGDPTSVLVQWIPVETELDVMIESVGSTYDNMSDPEELDLPGAADARGFTAEVMSQEAAVVFSQVDGGVFQVMVMSPDGTVEGATALTELTLSSI